MLGGEENEPFLQLLEGGMEGKMYQEMKDYFYFSQIRSKDENTTKARKLDGSVPLDEIANIMRAMGYYPTIKEIENMKNEVRFSQFSRTGQQVQQVDLDNLIRIYVNHRPVRGLKKQQIQEAVQLLSKSSKAIPQQEFLNLLMNKGEAFQEKELRQCLVLLVQQDLSTAIPEEITAEWLVQLLDFEDTEEKNQNQTSQIASEHVNSTSLKETTSFT